MIIVRIRAGLGNQMFQYAVGRALSIKRNESFKLDIEGFKNQAKGDAVRKYTLSFFPIKEEFATSEEIRRAKYPFGILSKFGRAFRQKVLKQHYVDYHPELMNGNVRYLDGYFQSEKYFVGIRDVLLRELALKDEYKSEAFKKWAATIAAEPASVCVHVRRADYVAVASTAKVHYVDLTEYYKKATAHILSLGTVTRAFVVSDDLPWCKENLHLPWPVTYVENPDLADYEQLTIMSHCTHNIIANSSFSWWGAWLNTNPHKVVTAPAQWTNQNEDHPNIVPDSWIKI